MRYPNPNMLLRIAQGDAYAMAAEYCERHPDEPEYQELREFKRYLTHPTYHKLKAGTYTDDTQMSIAVTEALVNDASGLFWENYLTHEQFAEHFYQAFKRDQRDGYSRPFQRILEAATSPTHLRSLIRPDSDKNGGCMRAVPIGVLQDPKRVIEVASMQAAVTHATYGGINSSVAVALMSHYALHDRRDFSSMFGWCVGWQPAFEYFRQPWSGPVHHKQKGDHGVGMMTAWAVCTLLQEQGSLLKIMRQVLDWGGDTDSVAAIAWGIASCRYPDEQLPAFFEVDLERENGSKYGPEFLKGLGKRLMQAYE